MQPEKSVEKIRQVYDLWESQKDVVLFGLGHTLKNNYAFLTSVFNIHYIYDNNPEMDGKSYEGVRIKHFHYDDNELFRYKILICTHYDDIAAQLKLCGLQENIDFCSLEKLVTLYHWFGEEKLYLSEVHITLTTKCTLNCEYCNMFMPYYSNPRNIEFENIKKDLELLFDSVDLVGTLALLGGEPFLYPDLKKVLDFVSGFYRDRIYTLEIITNGTVTVGEELLKQLKMAGVIVRISDYTEQVEYKERLKNFTDRLSKEGIPFIQNTSMEWLDFGFPNKKIKISNESQARHMLECAPAFKGLNDGRLYFCHVVWSAVKSGLISENANDYVKLKELDERDSQYRFRILLYSLGIMENGPVSLCRHCLGCSSANTKTVPAAGQKPRR